MPDDRAALPDGRGRRRARAHARRVRADRREARPRAQPGRARDVLAAVERALRLQALQAAAARRCRPRAATSSWARARTRARSTSAAGWPCAFKVESHNHPSAVEPFQGAATGVGGHPARHLRARRAADRRARLAALRRARRLASARATCSTARSPASATTATRSACRRSAARSTSRRRTSRTAWSTRWRSAWPRRERMIRSAAAGVGNVVVLFGASTGRDGIGGASVLASAELDEADGDKRPTVQVGDPFAEKKLMECSLELLERGLLVALQDLGAAGLTSSSAEMASKGGVGHRPRRRARAAARGRHGALRDHGLRVPGADALRREPARARRGARGVRDAGRCTAPRSARSPTAARCASSAATSWSATCPVAALVDDCPLYDLAPQRPAAPLYDPPAATLATGGSVARGAAGPAGARPTSPRAGRCSSSTTRSCSRAPCAARRRPTPRCCALPDGARSAWRIDGNGRRVAADPYHGTIAAMLECAANLACVGAEPLGVDQQPELRQPREAAHRLAAHRGRPRPGRRLPRARRAGDGGNVSLYNEAAPPAPDLPDAGHRHGRPPARRRARGAPGLRARGRRRRAGRLGRGAVAGGRRAGQAVGRAAARRPPADRPRAGARACSRRSATRCAPAR